MHKPIALEELDKEFFSSSEKDKKEEPETDSAPVTSVNETVTEENIEKAEVIPEGENTEKETEISPEAEKAPQENEASPEEKPEESEKNENTTGELINGVDFSDMPITAAQLKTMLGRDFGKKPDKIFHDLPDGEPSGHTERITVTQQEAEASFPVIEFDSEKLKPALMEDISDKKKRKIAEKEELKNHRDTAKKSIAEEKQRISEQKKLERSVSKPFRRRKLLVFLLVVFILFGFVLAGFGGLLTLSGIPKAEVSESLRYYPYYADGEKVVRDKGGDILMIVDSEASVQGGKEILVKDGENFSVGSVLFAGSDSYTLDMGSGMKKVTRDDIEGCVVYAFKGFSFMPEIWNLCVKSPVGAVAVLLIYYVSVTAIFVCFIKKQNEKIRKFRESYTLV